MLQAKKVQQKVKRRAYLASLSLFISISTVLYVLRSKEFLKGVAVTKQNKPIALATRLEGSTLEVRNYNKQIIIVSLMGQITNFFPLMVRKAFLSAVDISQPIYIYILLTL